MKTTSKTFRPDMQIADRRFELPIFLGCEQPETCRNCGARTEFEEVNTELQLHLCEECGAQYFVEFEDELADTE